MIDGSVFGNVMCCSLDVSSAILAYHLLTLSFVAPHTYPSIRIFHFSLDSGAPCCCRGPRTASATLSTARCGSRRARASLIASASGRERPNTPWSPCRCSPVRTLSLSLVSAIRVSTSVCLSVCLSAQVCFLLRCEYQTQIQNYLFDKKYFEAILCACSHLNLFSALLCHAPRRPLPPARASRAVFERARILPQSLPLADFFIARPAVGAQAARAHHGALCAAVSRACLFAQERVAARNDRALFAAGIVCKSLSCLLLRFVMAEGQGSRKESLISLRRIRSMWIIDKKSYFCRSFLCVHF